MSNNPQSTDDSKLLEQPFVAHLLELRDRLIKAGIAVVVLFLSLFYFANDIYLFIASPLIAHLPEGTTMIATDVASPFLAPFKLTLMVSVCLAMPFILFQLWAFIAPGLYKHEKKMVIPLVISSTILYYVGMAFAYYVVFPLVFAFLIGTTPDGIVVATDISKYLDFVLTLFFAFGIAFEVPIATILLVWMGVTTPQQLREKRPYVVVGAFVVGMFLTPPDVISQTLLALPMWFLYEVGIFFSQAFVRDKKPTDDEASGSTSIPDPFIPLTTDEMDQELDLIEAAEVTEVDEPKVTSDPIEAKFNKIQQLRDKEDIAEARKLLNEILADGNHEQRYTARNILHQLNE